MMDVWELEGGWLVARSMSRTSALSCFVAGLVTSHPGIWLLWAPANEAPALMVLCWVWVAALTFGYAKAWFVLPRGSFGSQWATAALRESIYLPPTVLLGTATTVLSAGAVLPAQQWTALVSMTASVLMLSQCVWILQRGGRDVVRFPNAAGKVLVARRGEWSTGTLQ